MFDYKITKKCSSSKARLGVYSTPHGDIETPCFMPVGTKGSVKTLTSFDLNKLNSQIILANTYHLELRPGSKLIAEMGGIHNWISWDKPILTDSGGFQVFSLGENGPRLKNNEKFVKITEDGVHFRSHIDGTKYFFSPEKVMEIQHNIGADIIMAFDECSSHNVSEEYTMAAMERTHRWLDRCAKYHLEHSNGDQALFGIIQGGMIETLRKQSAQYIVGKDLPGIAIGGLSVGENKNTMYKIIDYIISELPENKIRYLMGVGDPIDLIEAIIRGIDIFDCVLPTRLARHGTAFSENGNVNLLNEKHKKDSRPIQEGCECECCKNYSRSYLRHLIKEKEITGLKLITIHNIFFLFELINSLKQAISTDTTDSFLKKWRKKFDKH